MEDDVDKEFILENQIDKCRCCFRMLKGLRFVEITETIEGKFFELTQLNVTHF